MVRPRNRGELLNEILKRFKRGQYNLNDIDTSEITDMSSLFYGSYNFENVDISKLDVSEWDVSNVRYMYKTFAMCRDFNCDLSKWDVSNVKNMEYMFYNSKKFNSDLSKWDVSNVGSMNCMFARNTNLKVYPEWYLQK